MVVDGEADGILRAKPGNRLTHLPARTRFAAFRTLAGDADESIYAKRGGIIEILLGIIGRFHINGTYSVRRHAVIGAHALKLGYLRGRRVERQMEILHAKILEPVTLAEFDRLHRPETMKRIARHRQPESGGTVAKARAATERHRARGACAPQNEFSSVHRSVPFLVRPIPNPWRIHATRGARESWLSACRSWDRNGFLRPSRMRCSSSAASSST